MATLHLAVNQRSYTVDVDPQASLLIVLREHLDLRPRRPFFPSSSSATFQAGTCHRERKKAQQGAASALTFLQATGKLLNSPAIHSPAGRMGPVVTVVCRR
jgi:hypothetical protein